MFTCSFYDVHKLHSSLPLYRGFYKNNPDPFVQLASELWPGLKHSPTITHSFIALLEKKGLLLRNYTQNIDMLDVLAVSRELSLVVS